MASDIQCSGSDSKIFLKLYLNKINNIYYLNPYLLNELNEISNADLIHLKKDNLLYFLFIYQDQYKLLNLLLDNEFFVIL